VSLKFKRVFICWFYFDSDIWCSDTSLFEEINKFTKYLKMLC